MAKAYSFKKSKEKFEKEIDLLTASEDKIGEAQVFTD
jgi:hypothetical protein